MLSTLTATFHHVGLACRRIGDETACIAALGYEPETEVIDDPIQKVSVQFFVGAGPRIELIAPLAPDSPISAFLKRGTKFYHLAYEVADLDGAIRELGNHGFRPTGPTEPAAAFGMRRIVFVMAASGTLLEFIESVRKDSSPTP